MKAESEKERCAYEGLTYSHGTGLCVYGKCMLCEDGKWEDDSTIEQTPLTS